MDWSVVLNDVTILLVKKYIKTKSPKQARKSNQSKTPFTMGLRIMWGRPLAAACAAAVVLLSAVLLATAVPCGDLDRGQCMEMNATCVHCLSPEGCVARGSGDCDPDAVLDACFDCFAQVRLPLAAGSAAHII